MQCILRCTVSKSTNMLSAKLILSIIIFYACIGNAFEEGPFFRRAESLNAVAGRAEGTQSDDQVIIRRIIVAYQHATSAQKENRGDSMWQLFFHQHHQSIDQVFQKGRFNEAAKFLRDPGSSNLFYGIDNLCAVFLPSFSKPEDAHLYAQICLDGLARFAEIIGAINLDNPESYPYTPPQPFRADFLVEKIEKALNLSLVFPNPYPNEYGAWTPRGIVSYRVPQALYQAWRIKQLLKDIERPRVLEIGAGVGRTAYYAKMLGIEDYTIVDLPFTGLASSYFLARTLGEEAVLLSGEIAPNAATRIKILTPEEFLSKFDRYDLILNVDSLTEMDPQVAKTYWNHIESCGHLFLSINHETNSFTVKELINTSQRIAQKERSIYSMRRGYVEEIVRFK